MLQKGIFDNLGSSTSSSSGATSDGDGSDDSRHGAAAKLPTFDPTRLQQIAEVTNKSATMSRSDVRTSDSKGGKGKHGNRVRGTTNPSLADMRKRQRGGQAGVLTNPFQVEDPAIKGARRKVVHGGKSRTFK